LYTLIDEEAKSRARQIESACIKALRSHNFPLVSDADANHKSFGRSARGRKSKKQPELAEAMSAESSGHPGEEVTEVLNVVQMA
jgi:hypothetical protein